MTQFNEKFKAGMEYQKCQSRDEKDRLLGVVIAEFISDQLINHDLDSGTLYIDTFLEGLKPHVISALTDASRWGDELNIVEENGGLN